MNSNASTGEWLERLHDVLRAFDTCAIAFSGGTDSSALAAVAVDVLGAERCRAMIVVTPMMADGEFSDARRIADEIGIPLECIEIDPLDDEFIRRNQPDRCYHCKRRIFTQLFERAGAATLLSGDHAGDRMAYRPGRRALEELGIRSPLAECGLTKPEIRAIARHYQLRCAERPATPCLATRFAYGLELSHEWLRQVDAAEATLRRIGLGCELRVRVHPGELARIEIPESELGRFADGACRRRVLEAVRGAGFRHVTLDLAGFRSGSFDEPPAHL